MQYLPFLSIAVLTYRAAATDPVYGMCKGDNMRTRLDTGLTCSDGAPIQLSGRMCRLTCQCFAGNMSCEGKVPGSCDEIVLVDYTDFCESQFSCACPSS